MLPNTYLTLLVFGFTILGLVILKTRPVNIFGGTLISLIAFNLVTKEQFLASIANSGLVTLILLILCSLALEKTRLLRIIASESDRR